MKYMKICTIRNPLYGILSTTSKGYSSTVALETKYLTDLIKHVHRESHYTASVPSSLLQTWGEDFEEGALD